MNVDDLTDAAGAIYAFEVDNTWIDRAAVAAIVGTIPGARVLRLSWSWWGDDEFCEFELDGARFVAWEPFGDNSRYWIGPAEGRFPRQVSIVRSAFAGHRPLPSLPVCLSLATMVSGVALVALSEPLGKAGLWLLHGGALLGLGGVMRRVAAAQRLTRSRPPS